MWITHRNRFYTHDKYAFLRTSVAENEALANRYLDTAIRRIQRNAQFNVGIFQPGYDQQDYFAVYHYKSLINAYALNIDSAEHYFELLRASTIFPHNNYATFKVIQGDFRAGEEEYRLAQFQDPGDKRLQEWAYYSSILDIYKAIPKRGEVMMKEMITGAGSTPGFGWYNIALARCLLYDGQIGEAERHAERAAGFKELHIGTTLGQTHYDFSVQLNKLMTKDAEYEQQRFEHKDWWYSPGTLGTMLRKAGERYLQAFLIINQFAANPERDQVIYRLFSTESTISWDEVYGLVQNFSTRYFIRKFGDAAGNDPRPIVRKYFRLMIARLHIKEGDYKDAEPILNEILRDNTIDANYEKLFLARTYEALARCADGRDNAALRDEWLTKLYGIYPQLVPFCGMKMPMQLQVLGTPDAAVVARLRNCNIAFDTGTVRAQLTFSTQGKMKVVEYSVIDGAGNYIVPKQTYGYNDVNVAAVSLAYRLFGVGGVAPKGGDDEGV